MANRFPITVNLSNNKLEELPSGDKLDLTGSGIYDGTSEGTLDQILTSTGAGVSWKSIGQLTSNFLTTESDPVFTASPSASITLSNISEWNTAYGWGDHSQAGYLTSLGDAAGVTTIKIAEWDSAFSWGDHSQAGYLTSYTETDPVFTASEAFSISSQDKINWNSAYGWGDHSQAGYLTSYTETDPVFTASVAAGITLGDVSNWNTAHGWGDHSQAGYLTDISSSPINQLSDVIISGASNGQVLEYNGTNWVNVTPSYLSSYTETDTLSTVTSRGASTTVTCTFQDLNVSGNLNVLGTTTTNNVTTLNLTNNEIILNDGQSSGGLNAVITNDRGSDPNTSIRWNETNDRWEFTNNGTTFYNIPISTSELTNDSGYLTSVSSINDVGDVTISSPSSGQIIQFNGSQWVNVNSSITTSVDISETSPSNPTPGNLWWKISEETLKIYYDNGSTQEWVNASPDQAPLNNVYASIAFFPGANVNEGKFAYSEATGAMYYSNAVSWTSQRIVTTNNSNSSDFDTLLANTQLTYSIEAVDGASSSERNVRISDNKGVTSDVILEAGTGLSITRSNNKITFNNDVTDTTYSISSEPGAGSNATFRLTDNGGNQDNITFAGADGLIVENTDANTITFRAPDISAQLYTDEKAQDAVAAMFANGTHTNITFTYDDTNNSISATAQASGGGDGTTYDLLGSNTTSNNAIITLRDANNNDDSIEITGGGGTSVSWDGTNSIITVNSTAPVQADWNATSGLAQILNKPTIPAAYTLPIASSTVLGGFKVGANLTIDPVTGVLDANPGSYTLPTASASTLGGIKVGSGLSIDGNGVLTATGGSSVPQIQDLSGTTFQLSPDTTDELNITGYKAYSLFKITTDNEAWVRVYVDDASRDADTNRSEGEDPSPGSGVIAEVRTSGAESVLISPGIMGFNNDSPRTDTIYLAVTNRSGAATTITVTLTALQIGE